MATPRVFVASTCYDLKYIRESLSYFIKTLGYEPVLSEDGAVPYVPKEHTHDSCILEVPNCQLFVLIIGGRFGGKFKGTDKSITNVEYDEAIKRKIPILTLIEQGVHSDHYVFQTNSANPDVDETKIKYPNTNNIKIFEFIDTVRKAPTDNAIQPFRDFSDIEAYLQQQWAGMMFLFLTRDNEQNRVSDMMSQIANVGERVEFLSGLILKSSAATDETKLLGDLSVLLRDLFVLLGDNKLTQWYRSIGLSVTPLTILQNATLIDLAEASGRPIRRSKSGTLIRVGASTFGTDYLSELEKEYQEIRASLAQYIIDKGFTVENLLANQTGKEVI